jgi:beta-lactamase class A
VKASAAERTARLAVGLAGLAAGVVIGFVARDRIPDGGGRAFTEVRDGGYRWISPLLECDEDRDVLRNQELRPFRERVEASLRTPAVQAAVTSASVYFRELNDGIWFGINEAASYAPASMRKVPMMMAVLKQAEREPDLLTREVVATLQQDYDARQNFKPSQSLEPGRKYQVGELLSRMIVQSDNNAFMLVSGVVDPQQLGKVYGVLSLHPPSSASRGEETDHTVLTYAGFFRVLYNGTYLTKEMSDLALEHLTRTEFRDGLVAGLPSSVAVAHKFGERLDPVTGEKQLHDCGIVYYPRHPYLLCVMTKGPRFEGLADAIAMVSRTVFAEVDAQPR